MTKSRLEIDDFRESRWSRATYRWYVRVNVGIVERLWRSVKYEEVYLKGVVRAKF